MTAPIFVLEDEDWRRDLFHKHVPGCTVIADPDEFLAAVGASIGNGEDPAAIFLDHDLQCYRHDPYKREVTGYDVCRYLEVPRETLVVVHSLNPPSAQRMLAVLRDRDYTNVRRRDFAGLLGDWMANERFEEFKRINSEAP